MVKIFGRDYPALLILLFFLLLILRTPLIVNTIPLSINELRWMLIGEKMGMGFHNYSQIWNTLEPFSAGVYWIIDLCFGRSQLSYQILASLLIFVQAILLNEVMKVPRFFERLGYVPGIVYILFASISSEYFTLSPQLMGTTFIIASLGYLFNIHADRSSDKQIIYSGVLIGIATLFYFPFITFLTIIWFAMALFRSDNLREMILPVLGMAIPFLFVSVYYFFNDGITDFFAMSFLGEIQYDYKFFVNKNTILIIFSIPIFLFILSLINLRTEFARNIIHVKNCQQLLLFWILASLISFLWIRNISLYSFFPMLAPITVFVAYWLIKIKRAILSDILIIFLLLYSFVFHFQNPKDSVVFGNEATQKSFYVRDSDLIKDIHNKSIMVLGSDLNYYKNNYLGTPYLDWILAQKHFNNLESYANVFGIYSNLAADPPEYIIDLLGIFEPVLNKIPLFKHKFTKIEDSMPPVYKLNEQ